MLRKCLLASQRAQSKYTSIVFVLSKQGKPFESYEGYLPSSV